MGVNVALNRPAYQSSVYVHLGLVCNASKANDGNRNPAVIAGSCSVTKPGELYPWWAVDLVAALYVLGVKLTNRDVIGNNGYVLNLIIYQACMPVCILHTPSFERKLLIF